MKKQRGGLNWEEELNSPTAEEKRGMALLAKQRKVNFVSPTGANMRKSMHNVITRMKTRRNKTRAVGSRILPRGQKLRYDTP